VQEGPVLAQTLGEILRGNRVQTPRTRPHGGDAPQPHQSYPYPRVHGDHGLPRDSASRLYGQQHRRPLPRTGLLWPLPPGAPQAGTAPAHPRRARREWP
jgi:hypothetical protein